MFNVPRDGFADLRPLVKAEAPARYSILLWKWSLGCWLEAGSKRDWKLDGSSKMKDESARRGWR
jgi:hypothetical protein